MYVWSFLLGERRNQMRKDAESPSHCRMHYTEIKETSSETFSETRSHVMHQNNRNKPCSMFPIRFLYLHESSSIHILNPSKSTLLPFETSFSHIDILISVEATTSIFHSLRCCHLQSCECSDRGNALQEAPKTAPTRARRARVSGTCAVRQMVLWPVGKNDNWCVCVKTFLPA